MKTGTKDPYAEIVRRRAGGEATVARAARRRQGGPATSGEATDAGGDVVTDTHPEDVTAQALTLATLSARLQVPGASAEALRELSEHTDEHVGSVAQVMTGLLGTFPKVAAAAGTTKEAQEARVKQRTEMLLLRSASGRLRQQAMDSRRATSGALRDGMRELAALLREDTKGRGEAQEQLRSDAAEFLGLWTRVEEAPLSERDRTAREGERHAAELQAESSEVEYLRTMLALRSGEAVDPAAWDRAARRLGEERDAEAAAAKDAPGTSPDRRDRGR